MNKRLLLPPVARSGARRRAAPGPGRNIRPRSGRPGRGRRRRRGPLPSRCRYEAFPRAKCGDGTDAVFYVRRFSGEVNRDRWVLFLQGGGFCIDGQDCANRWKSSGTAFGAQKLSSDFTPPVGIADRGIQRLNDGVLPDNNLADWNQVFIYYCSSDNWTGRGQKVVVSADDPSNSGSEIDYSIHFAGAYIFESVIRTLRQQHGVVEYDEVGGATKRMPHLDDATNILFTGASAGAHGVVKNADRFYQELKRTNHGCRAAKPRRQPCPLQFATVRWLKSSCLEDILRQ